MPKLAVEVLLLTEQVIAISEIHDDFRICGEPKTPRTCQDILEQVLDKCNIMKRHCFGLSLLPPLENPQKHNKIFVNLSKKPTQYSKFATNYKLKLNLEVLFYVEQIIQLPDSMTLLHYYLQMKENLKKLPNCVSIDACMRLLSHIVLAEDMQVHSSSDDNWIEPGCDSGVFSEPVKVPDYSGFLPHWITSVYSPIFIAKSVHALLYGVQPKFQINAMNSFVKEALTVPEMSCQFARGELIAKEPKCKKDSGVTCLLAASPTHFSFYLPTLDTTGSSGLETADVSFTLRNTFQWDKCAKLCFTNRYFFLKIAHNVKHTYFKFALKNKLEGELFFKMCTDICEHHWKCAPVISAIKKHQTPDLTKRDKFRESFIDCASDAQNSVANYQSKDVILTPSKQDILSLNCTDILDSDFSDTLSALSPQSQSANQYSGFLDTSGCSSALASDVNLGGNLKKFQTIDNLNFKFEDTSSIENAAVWPQKMSFPTENDKHFQTFLSRDSKLSVPFAVL